MDLNLIMRMAMVLVMNLVLGPLMDSERFLFSLIFSYFLLSVFLFSLSSFSFLTSFSLLFSSLLFSLSLSLSLSPNSTPPKKKVLWDKNFEGGNKKCDSSRWKTHDVIGSIYDSDNDQIYFTMNGQLISDSCISLKIPGKAEEKREEKGEEEKGEGEEKKEKEKEEEEEKKDGEEENKKEEEKKEEEKKEEEKKEEEKKEEEKKFTIPERIYPALSLPKTHMCSVNFGATPFFFPPNMKEFPEPLCNREIRSLHDGEKDLYTCEDVEVTPDYILSLSRFFSFFLLFFSFFFSLSFFIQKNNTNKFHSFPSDPTLSRNQ